VSAEIFQFPNQERQIRLSVGLASLDEVVAKIERLMTGAEPDADLHHLLDVIQRFSERLTELGHLLLVPRQNCAWGPLLTRCPRRL
jgi:hypothetical protein